MMYILQILALLKKELLMMWLDSGTRKILFIPILIQAIIFGYAATFNLNNVPYSILNLSNSKDAFNLEHTLAHNQFFKLVNTCYDLRCLNSSIDNEKVLLALYIPKDFNNSHEIMVIADAKNTASASSALAYLNTLVTLKFQQETLNTRFVYNENIITRHSILTGMILALSMIQVLMLSSLCISREKENKTFDMMIMTPTPTLTLLIGKAAAPVLVALLQSLILFCICLFYFKIPFLGNFLLLSFSILIFSISLVGIGLTISTLTKTTQQSIVFAFTLILPCIVLSSLITPIEAIPSWFLPLVYINPLFYGIQCVQGIYLEGKDFHSIYPYFIPLLILAALTLPICAYFFRHKLK